MKTTEKMRGVIICIEEDMTSLTISTTKVSFFCGSIPKNLLTASSGGRKMIWECVSVYGLDIFGFIKLKHNKSRDETTSWELLINHVLKCLGNRSFSVLENSFIIDASIENLERILNYSFKNRALLKEALTHRYLRALNYKRFQFLGDVVLGNFSFTTEEWRRH